MIRRFVGLVVAFAGASVAVAQMPPSIKKPIEQARKNVNATNAQTAAVNAGATSTPAAPQKAAPAPATTAANPQAAAKASAPAASQATDSTKVTFEREVFTYVPRELDPFSSPIESGAIRPLVADLKVVGIIYDPAGRNSVAVMRDISTQQQYRAKPGQMLGRARVSQIRPQEVVLTIEEYGFSRQETLKLNVQQTQQTKGKP
ncbi:MAG: hypothetical protein Q8K55_07745 [Gemmatimonadaceae bacterium]|nr:hypothetical protein [Gemmatimonadaceae bacterium]